MVVRSLASVVPSTSVRFLGHDTHEHDEPHLIYAVSGSATVQADQEEITLRRHEAVWLAPRVPHSVRLHDRGFVLGPLLDPDDTPPQRVRPVGVVPALVDLMTTVLGAAPSNDDEIAPFRAAIGAVLSRVGRQYFVVTAPTHPSARALAREAMRSPLTLDQLAEKHRMSARQVQRIFTDETGLPFARWRSRARLNVAISHVTGGGDLAVAARLAGYGTRAGLVRALSRETGLPYRALSDEPARALAPDTDPADARRSGLIDQGSATDSGGVEASRLRRSAASLDG